MHATQEGQTAITQSDRNGDVGRQHELLNDLVAFVVLPLMGTGHAPLFVEVEPDLRHVELQRPLLKATITQHHRQFVHA